MKILIDQDIPFIESLFAGVGDLIKKPGRHIVSNDLKDIDALIVRSITVVDDFLIKDANNLKFVGSVTSGDDHLDKIALNARGISYYVAKGCNAPAVVCYVLCTIAALQSAHKLSEQPVIAIVGVGCVGGLLANTLKKLGFSVVLYDPPRAEQETNFISCEWHKVLQADLICLHLPLEKSGDYPTYHLINAEIMRAIRSGTVILNAARGAIVDNQAIKTAGQHITWCLDVWENEPSVDLELLEQVYIATPHIAGYSQESQERAATMVYQAFCRRFSSNQEITSIKHALFFDDSVNWRDAALNRLDLLDKTSETKTKLLFQHATFDSLREAYRGVSDFINESRGQAAGQRED